mgnify:CR=1 FL=1|jgi:Domain of Unknown Function (DUF1080).
MTSQSCLRLFASLCFAMGLGRASTQASAATPNSDALSTAIERAASAHDDAARHATYRDLLSALGENNSLSTDERLRGAWAAWLLAANDHDRAPLLALSATIPDVRTRMLIGAFRDYPALRKQWAEVDRTHSALLLAGKPPNESRRPRDLFGLNPFDAPFTADGWTDPDGFVGRWTALGVTVDILAYPLQNFLGLLRTDSTPERRLVGLKQGSSLRLIGRGAQGRLEADTLTLDLDGRSHELRRTPVGYTYFSFRPPGARVLLDPTTGLRHFRHSNGEPGAWKILPDGAVEIDPAKGSLFSRDAWNDHRLYLEFRHAYNSESVGPRRGNSGLYVYNSYELQLIDSFGLPPTETSEGSIYHLAVPRITASAPPLEWQSLELVFRAPRFDSSGRKIAHARLTVWLNGTMIHDNVEILHPTGGSPAGGREQKDAPGPQPFMLQNHGALLQFRNIWVAPEDVL